MSQAQLPDLATIPVIDTHCHPFPIDQTAVSQQLLFNALSVSLRTDADLAVAGSMMLVRRARKELARVLGCATDWESIMAARNARAAADKAALHELFCADANVAALLIDPGFPMEPTIEAPEFSASIGRPVYEGYRIERFFAEVGAPINGGRYATLADFVAAFLERLDAEAARPEVRFFKTVIAYATGLAISKVTEAQAQAAWDEHRALRDAADKVLRDYLFWQTALKAREHGLPFQVHTGHTSNANIWPDVNPIRLTPLLNEPEMGEVQFVLVHGGYPYCTEAGYITSVFPNVALDLSLMIPWSSSGVARRIEETLEAAPTRKIMYGSDGIWTPEMYWLSAIVARQALGRVLDRHIADGFLDTDEAGEVARDVLYRNALRIYGLQDLNVEES